MPTPPRGRSSKRPRVDSNSADRALRKVQNQARREAARAARKRVDIDPRDLIVTYGIREHGELGYILATRVYRPDGTKVGHARVVVFQSNRKSEVIAEAQRRKGWEPVDGSEQTYAQQIVDRDGESR